MKFWCVEYVYCWSLKLWSFEMVIPWRKVKAYANAKECVGGDCESVICIVYTGTKYVRSSEVFCTQHSQILSLSMRPKAREMTQHGGPPVWLEESDPAGWALCSDGRSKDASTKRPQPVFILSIKSSLNDFKKEILVPFRKILVPFRTTKDCHSCRSLFLSPNLRTSYREKTRSTYTRSMSRLLARSRP